MDLLDFLPADPDEDFLPEDLEWWLTLGFFPGGSKSKASLASGGDLRDAFSLRTELLTDGDLDVLYAFRRDGVRGVTVLRFLLPEGRGVPTPRPAPPATFALLAFRPNADFGVFGVLFTFGVLAFEAVPSKAELDEPRLDSTGDLAPRREAEDAPETENAEAVFVPSCPVAPLSCAPCSSAEDF